MKRHSRGATIVFGAISIGALLLALGFAMYIGLSTVASLNLQSIANYIALSSIQAYYAEGGGSCPTGEIQSCHLTKSAAAMQRADEVISANPDLVGFVLTRKDGGYGNSGNTTVELGRFEVPKNSSESDPVFSPLSGASSVLANAARVTIVTQPRGILEAFGKMVLKQLANFEATAIATAVPLSGCFVVDLSGSSTYSSHPPENSRYSFHYVFDSYGSEKIVPTEDDALFSRMPGSGAGPSRDDYKLAHGLLTFDTSTYGQQFSALHPAPLSPGVASTLLPSTSMLVDDVNAGQPLFQIFAGLENTVRLIKQRQVPGDQVCFVFYDQDVYWPRVLKLTDDFDYALSMVAHGPVATFPSPQPKWIQHRLFPLSDAPTNSSAGLNAALAQFVAARTNYNKGVTPLEFVVHFGDGVSNVWVQNGVTWGPHNQPTPPLMMYEHYLRSLGAVRSLVYGDAGFLASGISLHVALYGDHVGPHNIEHPSSNNAKQCLSDAELRQKYGDLNAPRYVVGGDKKGVSYPDNFLGRVKADSDLRNALAGRDLSNPQSTTPPPPFFQVNADWYELAVGTGGSFIPVRRVPKNCVPRTPCDPPFRDGEIADRVLVDPACGGVATQLRKGLADILDQLPFTLVKEKH